MKHFLIIGKTISMILLFSTVSFGYTDIEKREMMKQSPQQHSIEDYMAMIANRIICDSIDWIRSTEVVPKYRNKWDSWVREQEIKQQEFERSQNQR